jgi:hypothetical protein
MSWRLARATADPDATFRVSSNGEFLNTSLSLSDDVKGFWLVYNANTISPIALVQYLTITNLRSTPETIHTCSVAMHTENCGWMYLTPMPIYESTVVWTGSGMTKAYALDFKSNGLSFLFEKPIPPHETISGWWFFDSKIKCDIANESRVSFRISLATFSGLEYEYTTPAVTFSKKFGDFGSTVGTTKLPDLIPTPGKPALDISRFYNRQLYSSVPGLRF